MSWETRHSNKKKLVSRLKDELEDHSNKYKESWTTMTVLEDEKDIEKSQKNIDEMTVQKKADPENDFNYKVELKCEGEMEELVTKLENRIAELHLNV